MAEAPGHRLGQIIGDTLEDAIKPVLQAFADVHGLYLDSKGTRQARSGVKCSWTDDLGNSHDLDFVLERGGSSNEVGLPAGFIETAWRRYTKHSRAKAQEIQGAVLPLLAKYAQLKPFVGVPWSGGVEEFGLHSLSGHDERDRLMTRLQRGYPDDGGSERPKVAKCLGCNHRVSFHSAGGPCLASSCQCRAYSGATRKWETHATVEELAEVLDVTTQWLQANSGAFGATWVEWSDLWVNTGGKDLGKVLVFPLVRLKRILDTLHDLFPNYNPG